MNHFNFIIMQDLKIVGLNLDIQWENKLENYRKIESELSNMNSDLVLLPEMFSTGFHMDPEKIADCNEETLEWMKKLAQENKTAVCGSVSVKDKGKFYNRFYFVQTDGSFDFYDKRHLFSYSGEHQTYHAGKQKVIVNFKGWRILLQVCYDLRFPVFSRNKADYDAILYVANWPKTRIEAWTTLLKARAIENQAYVFGLNRIGIDGNNLEYPESSRCFFADGTEISKRKGNLINATFVSEKLQLFRKKFPFLSDRDDFTIN